MISGRRIAATLLAAALSIGTVTVASSPAEALRDTTWPTMVKDTTWPTATAPAPRMRDTTWPV